MSTSDLTTDDSGFASAVATAGKDPADAEGYARECADTKAWLKRIKHARKFDESARKQYAIDRRYARGDKGKFEISVPIAGSYTDILKSFLYARNPDLDVQPAEATSPPPMAEIIEMARQKIAADPQTHQTMLQVGVQAEQAAAAADNQATGLAPVAALAPMAKAKVSPLPPGEEGEQAAQAWLDATIKAAAKQILAPYRQKLSQAKQLGKTLELVVASLWKKARLKLAADDEVGSCITVGIGWLKVTWQERNGSDPTTTEDNRDMQDLLARLTEAQRALAAGEETDEEAAEANITQLEAGIGSKVEVIVARGLAIDFVKAQDMQVAVDVPSLRNYLDSPWIAHRSFVPIDQAKARYPKVAEKLGKAGSYYPQKMPDPLENRHIGEAIETIDAKEADDYRSNDSTGDRSEEDACVCVWELWNRDNGNVLTLIEGIDEYAQPTFTPNPGTTRFYPFFMLAMIWVDGERHPQSLIKQTSQLLDDMNRLYSNRAEHRRRAIPKTGFDSTGLEPSEVAKIAAGGIGEMIPLKLMNPGASIGDLLKVIEYPRVDDALYDKRPTMEMLEIRWGIQEALASSIQTAKTATEAEIQQTGTNARTTHMRSAIDDEMDDLALYTAEVALQKLGHDDAVQIAGAWAYWPQGITTQDLSLLVEVSIKGGSSGKPDTTAQQRSWATTMPILQQTLLTIGQLRGSAPSDIADCLEELVSETLSRTGDRLDPSRFLPPAPSAEPGQMPPPQAQQPGPGMPQGPSPGAPAGPAPMPAIQPPTPDPGVLPVPHAGHIYVEPHNGAHQ